MPRSSVLPVFKQLSIDREASLDYMYLDIYGLVTTGIGNLIDTSSKNNIMGGTIPEVAYDYGWVIDGRLATKPEIYASWKAVKERQDMAKGGGKHFNKIPENRVRLPPDALERLYDRTLENFENTLRKHFPSYDAWPADAQLGLLSMAWALGPNFTYKYPRFTAAANQVVPDFVTMARESGLSDNPKRTADHEKAFLNAAAVVRGLGDPDITYFPESLISGAVQIARENPGKTSLLGVAMFAGLSYLGIKKAKEKGWVK